MPKSRRAFLRSTATAAAATFIAPHLVRGSQANAKLTLGLIGCGGRGKWIAKLFQKHGGYQFAACADYFADRSGPFAQQNGLDASKQFTGLDGYKRVLDQKLDAVVIETPPYFHPQQAADAVAAGKHVFLAKPIAVDAPGCQSIAESGRQATAKKLVFLVDFQTRANALFRETARRIRAGDIGQIVAADAHYPWAGGGRGVVHTDAEDRLRRWYVVKELSGDFIVEQSIHALDVATWWLDADPIQAVGTGGKTVRLDSAIWDHFAVTYWFPQQVSLAFSCIQAIPGVKDEISARIFGAEGVAYGDYFGDVWIRGKKPFEGGTMKNLYTEGAEVNIAEFHEAVAKGDCSNSTVAPSVRSNLTAILGREAGYAGQVITLAQLLKEGKRLEFDTKGLKG